MFKTITCFLIMLSSIPGTTAVAQEHTQRYRDNIFDDVETIKHHYYNSNLPDGVKKKYYKYDLYQPEGDSNTQRPLVIWMHGGGFKLGNKRSRGIPGWCRQFAKKGYVCAAINYRKSKKKTLSRFPDLVDGCYDAVTDLQQAVAYFKAHSSEYGIDTSRIILAGNSAGGIIALQAAYSTPAELSKLFPTKKETDKPDQLFVPETAAIINFWGGIFDTAWLQNATVPIVSVHGKGDNLVPYTKDETPLSGSFLIKQEADALGIPNALKTYDNYRHELQKRFNPFLALWGPRKRWEEAGEFAADFLYTTYFSGK